MTLYITDADLEEYDPGSSTPDSTIPGNDIYSFDVEERTSDLKDTGKLAIDNKDDQYTNVLDHGDKIELTIHGDMINGPIGFGAGGFGVGPFGDSKQKRVWTGLVRNYTITYHGASVINLEIDAEDFVFAVMGFRKVYNDWRDRQIVGSNGIINEVLENECPEIDRSLLPDRPETTSISAFGTTVLDLVSELSYRLPAVVYSHGDALNFQHPDSLSPRFTLETRDHGTLTFGSQDDNMRNLVRVRGGTASSIDDQQTTQDGTQTVTDSNFATQRINTRKSFLSQIDLYTVADRTGEDIIVRLQKDDGSGGGPIAPDDDTSDIASKRLSAEFLDDNGYTLFLLPTDSENVLPEPNPWMIVQTDGSTGQDIGIDTATGNLTYKAFYPYPIVLEQQDSQSVDDHRLRDGEVSKSSISTFGQGQDKADEYLNENSGPTETLKLNAESPRMHAHRVGHAVQVDTQAASGPFVAMEKKSHYEENQLTTDFSLKSLESI